MIRILTFCALLLTHATLFGQQQTGKASFYADKFEGHLTASGEKYKHSKLTAAHRTLPFGTRVKVTNLANNKTVEVVINDRGPYVDDRIIDLSRSAAEQLDFIQKGLADVKVVVTDAGDGKGGGQIVPIDHVAVDEKEYYDFEIDRLAPGGFGVQIGTYQELVNLMRLADNLKKSYQKKVIVQVKIVKGVKYYALLLGTFSSRNRAESLLKSVRNKFPDAFIVEFDRL
ncbi:MAG: septal ring lytic transglycosylase RlpA family protein [Cyclobacteriaceae bacterium]|nr:septal ring lytic transglycosylase RlpA family protein [Cyclobacteriaceae bacterium]